MFVVTDTAAYSCTLGRLVQDAPLVLAKLRRRGAQVTPQLAPVSAPAGRGSFFVGTDRRAYSCTGSSTTFTVERAAHVADTDQEATPSAAGAGLSVSTDGVGWYGGSGHLYRNDTASDPFEPDAPFQPNASPAKSDSSGSGLSEGAAVTLIVGGVLLGAFVVWAALKLRVK
jgi:hypothetical protein